MFPCWVVQVSFCKKSITRFEHKREQRKSSSTPPDWNVCKQTFHCWLSLIQVPVTMDNTEEGLNSFLCQSQVQRNLICLLTDPIDHDDDEKYYSVTVWMHGLESGQTWKTEYLLSPLARLFTLRAIVRERWRVGVGRERTRSQKLYFARIVV